MSQQKPPGRIVGQVVVAADNTPAAQASVRIVVDGVIVDAKMTNTRGTFNSRLLFSGLYRVEADVDGLHGGVDDVEVRLGEVTNIEISLS